MWNLRVELWIKRSLLVRISALLVNGIRTKQAAGLYLILIDIELAVPLGLLQQHLLRHHKKLVKVHLLLLPQVFLYFLLRLRLLSGRLELVNIDHSIFGLVGIEGVLDLHDLVLVETLIEVLLDLEVPREGVGLGLSVSHLKLCRN